MATLQDLKKGERVEMTTPTVNPLFVEKQGRLFTFIGYPRNPRLYRVTSEKSGQEVYLHQCVRVVPATAEEAMAQFVS